MTSRSKFFTVLCAVIALTGCARWHATVADPMYGRGGAICWHLTAGGTWKSAGPASACPANAHVMTAFDEQFKRKQR